MKMIQAIGALAMLITMALPSVASAGNCRNVDITIQNHTGGEIKIKKIWHYDYGKGKWRTNSTTNRRLDNNYQTTYTKNLQYVKGESTRVKVLYYQYDIMYDIWAEGDVFNCDNNDRITIDIDQPGTMDIFIDPNPNEGRPVPSNW